MADDLLPQDEDGDGEEARSEENLTEMGQVGSGAAEQPTGEEEEEEEDAAGHQQTGERDSSNSCQRHPSDLTTRSTRTDSETDSAPDQQTSDWGRTSPQVPGQSSSRSSRRSLQEHLRTMPMADLEKLLVRHLTGCYPHPTKENEEETGGQSLPGPVDTACAYDWGAASEELGLKRKNGSSAESLSSLDKFGGSTPPHTDGGERQRSSTRPRHCHPDTDPVQLFKPHTEKEAESEATSMGTCTKPGGAPGQTLAATLEEEYTGGEEAAGRCSEFLCHEVMTSSDSGSDSELSHQEDLVPDSSPASWTLIPDHRVPSTSKSSTKGSISKKKKRKSKDQELDSFLSEYVCASMNRKGKPPKKDRKQTHQPAESSKGPIGALQAWRLFQRQARHSSYRRGVGGRTST